MKKYFLLIILNLSVFVAFAQLPNIEVIHAKGRNIISWVNTYQGLSSIQIQRSSDSSRNYATIGNLNKPAKGANAWSDDYPLAGKNYYQLVINFNEDVNWMSNRRGIVLDSTIIAKGKEMDIEIAKNAAVEKAKIESPGLIKEDIIPEFIFTPSSHVYTNPYSGHVNVTLENTISRKYSLVFYLPNNKEAFKIDRLSIDHIVIDKHNFNGRGVFAFSLLESGTEVEKGFVLVN
jgi:hypothetical protein